jgi:hypothetical protein
MRTASLPLVMICLLAGCSAAAAQVDVPDSRVAPGSKVFIAPMNGFETYLMAAFSSKKMPLIVVSSRDEADFEVAGISESQKPGWVRTLLNGDTGTDEQASIAVKNIRTGVVAFGYAVNLKDSFRGKQSAAESCAKHLKDKVEQDAKSFPTQRSAVVVASTNEKNVAAVVPARSARTIVAFIQADSADEEFVSQMRSALANEGIELRAVGRGAPFDYNIVLTRERTSAGPAAAVVVLDSNGTLLVSSARSGFRSKGAAGGAAEEVAKKLAAILR